MWADLVAWCSDYPWYTAAAVFFVASVLLLIDVGSDVPLLFSGAADGYVRTFLLLRKKQCFNFFALKPLLY